MIATFIQNQIYLNVFIITTLMSIEIKTPIFVIAGKYDFGAPYYLWEDYHNIIPDFTLKVYENAGHNPFMEIPEDFAKYVLSWVKSKE